MNEMQTFTHDTFGIIRTTTIDGEPWFVAKDVCAALELSNVSKAVTSLDEDEKGITTSNTLGGEQQMLVISEAGMYSLVMRSRKPEAKSFKRWVTHFVLPSIRKHGGYMVAKGDETPEETMARAVLLAQDTINRINERNRQLEADNNAKDERITQMRPKEVFADAVATSKSDILVGELAKIIRQNGYNIGQNRLFAWMRDNGYLIKSGNAYNMPTQRAADMGLFRVKETPIVHADGHVDVKKTTKVTGKGQIYFVNKFCSASQTALSV